MQELFDTNLVKIHSVAVEILSFSCFALFFLLADDHHLGMQCCKKIKMAPYKKHSGTKLDQFQPRVLEILLFSGSCYF